MKQDTAHILDGLLGDWHRWALGYQYVAGIGSSAMFKSARSSRGYESESDITEATLHGKQMESINFHVFELPSMQWITAIQMQARNIATGTHVWRSPRLPADIEARAVLLRDARNALVEKLQGAGVI
jgi:hypothetical protein